MSEKDWVKDLGRNMIEYIYDGEYYILPDGTRTRQRPTPTKKETDPPNTIYIPLSFWFAK